MIVKRNLQHSHVFTTPLKYVLTACANDATLCISYEKAENEVFVINGIV